MDERFGEDEEEDQGKDGMKVEDDEDDGVPYDKGWAWMITLGAFVLFFVYVSYGQVIAVLLLDFLNEFNVSVSIITVMLSLTNVFYCIATQTSATVLVPRFSNRSVDTCAALINVLATLTFVAVPNMVVLFIVSLVKYTVKGLTLISTMTLVGFYFRRRRALATALCAIGNSVSAIVAPPIVRYLRDEYGLRGCFLLFAGFELHAVVASLLLRPLDSYKKKTNKTARHVDQENLDTSKPKENSHQQGNKDDVSLHDGPSSKAVPHLHISESSDADTGKSQPSGNSQNSATACPSCPDETESRAILRDSDPVEPLLTPCKEQGKCGENHSNSEDTGYEAQSEISLGGQQSNESDFYYSPKSIVVLKEKDHSENRHNIDSEQIIPQIVTEEEEVLLRRSFLNKKLRLSGAAHHSKIPSNSLVENASQVCHKNNGDSSISPNLSKWESMASSIIGSSLNIGPIDSNSNAKTRRSKYVICSSLATWLDTALLKNVLCIMIVLTYALTNASLFTIIYLPSYATKVGLSPQNSAVLLSISGFLDLFGRVSMGYFVDLKLLRPGTVLAVVSLCLGVVHVLAGLYTIFETLVFFSVMIGFLGAAGQTTLTVLIVDVLGIGHLAEVMALSSGCLSIFLVVQHPIQDKKNIF